MKALFGVGKTRDPRRDSGGAVMVEFLIAYLPVLVAFLMFWQLGEILVAQMIVERASSAAGRAAVVVLPDDPAFYDAQDQGLYDGERKREVRLAAGMMLAASPHLSENFTVDVQNLPAGDDSVQEVTVEVDAEFRCKRLTWVCGADGITVLSASSQHTYQGANYQYEPTDLSNLGQNNSSTANDPGCSDTDTPDGKGGKGNGSGGVPGKGSGGKGSGGSGGGAPDNSGSCPPGETENKDGSCSKSRGNNDKKCADGSPTAPDGLCNDGTCPGSSKKPKNKADGSPGDADQCDDGSGGSGSGSGGGSGAGGRGGAGGSGGACSADKSKGGATAADVSATDAQINSDCTELKKSSGSKWSKLKAKIKGLFSKRKTQAESVCPDPPPAPACDAANQSCPEDGGPPDDDDWKKRDCDNCQTLYSGRCFTPSDAFSNGLWAKGANLEPLDLDLRSHVGVSSTTGFISTSTDPEVAAGFASSCGEGKKYVYEMRVCGGIKVNYAALAEEAACSPKPGKMGPAYFNDPDVIAEKEVSVVKGFQGSDIIAAYDVSNWSGEGNPLVDKTKNKKFQSSNADRIRECKASVARGEVAQ